MDSWLGAPKKSLIMQLGPPDRVASDGSNGEILIYGAQYYNAYYRITTYRYTMYFVYPGGTIYHWLIKEGRVPPQQMDVDMYIH